MGEGGRQIVVKMQEEVAVKSRRQVVIVGLIPVVLGSKSG